ncbi:BGP_1a_G0039780.mRNA.1.CDS.1 [Saccharomyces cerevisiae]|nr:BGP_1a_G0039780.mRNA.1.CDS.1 [Saccharomyces cerevisiae]CAI7227653.1 BGP_1a_G0039780.mRNA.1.CDS.1 [Saccharomyces cerevisiae]
MWHSAHFFSRKFSLYNEDPCVLDSVILETTSSIIAWRPTPTLFKQGASKKPADISLPPPSVRENYDPTNNNVIQEPPRTNC